VLLALLKMLADRLIAERLEDAQRRWSFPFHAPSVVNRRAPRLVGSGRPASAKSWER
jgi:hypothetical protein